MLLVPHVLVSVAGLVEGEDLFVDDGLDVVCFDGAVHLLELQPAAHEDAADGADVVLGEGIVRLLEGVDFSHFWEEGVWEEGRVDWGKLLDLRGSRGK